MLGIALWFSLFAGAYAAGVCRDNSGFFTKEDRSLIHAIEELLLLAVVTVISGVLFYLHGEVLGVRSALALYGLEGFAAYSLLYCTAGRKGPPQGFFIGTLQWAADLLPLVLWPVTALLAPLVDRMYEGEYNECSPPLHLLNKDYWAILGFVPVWLAPAFLVGWNDYTGLYTFVAYVFGAMLTLQMLLAKEDLRLQARNRSP